MFLHFVVDGNGGSAEDDKLAEQKIQEIGDDGALDDNEPHDDQNGDGRLGSCSVCELFVFDLLTNP